MSGKCAWLCVNFCMLVGMRVWLNAIPFKVMRMLMMRVMTMAVFVLQRSVFMLMHMMFCEVQPHAQGHHRRSRPKTKYWWAPQTPRLKWRHQRTARSRSTRLYVPSPMHAKPARTTPDQGHSPESQSTSQMTTNPR